LGINGERYFTKRQVQSMIKDSYFAVDALTQRDNVFTRMDARIKVILCITAVITVFAIPGFKFALGLFGVIMAALFFIRAPRRLIIGRLIAPLVLGAIVFLLLVFSQSGHPMFTLNILSLKLVGYREGAILGIIIMARASACVSLLLLLSMTTPLNELGYALVYLKFPKVIVEILLLTYRYLFVLWDEGMRIRQAQVLRLGYGYGLSSWKRSVKSTGTLMAMVLIRAYDRAEHTFNAMLVRSYNGDVTGSNYKSWNSRGTH